MNELRENASLKAIAEHTAQLARRADREWRNYESIRATRNDTENADQYQLHESHTLFRRYSELKGIATHVGRHAGIAAADINTRWEGGAR